jgi:hypothetical protein
VVNIFSRVYLTSPEVLVGGRRSEIFKVLFGLKTLPAVLASGKSAAPITES